MSEENKQGLTPSEEADFDENCQFLEDIQKLKEPEEPPVEEFVDLETEGKADRLSEKKQSRLERLAERQNRRETREEERLERREAREEERLERREERQERREVRAEERQERREEREEARLERLENRRERHEQRREERQEAAQATTEPAEAVRAEKASALREHANKTQEKLDEHRFTKLRATVLQMVEVGFNDTGIARAYDVVHMFAIFVNIVVSILYTYDYFNGHYHTLLYVLEFITVTFFAIDYVLRLWTAPLLYPQERSGAAVRKYAFSMWGIIDLISFLPFYLPFFPKGGAVFRVLRVVRIFRLFRVNSYSDSFGAVVQVLKNKRQQLFSSVFIIFVLMLAGSLCLYGVEHDAQPDVFRNALSGVWWACSALLTVGYGDMVPITVAGKILAMIITILGVGMVAVPTGIISAGFVEQYQRLREQEEEASEVDFHFIKVQLGYNDVWVGMQIMDLNLPNNLAVAVIQRGSHTIVPRGDVVLKEKDTLVLGAESAHDNEWNLDLKEIVLKRKHPWNGQFIRDLDISRQTFIVLVRRKNRSMVPNGNLMLKEGDTVVLYSKKHIQDAVDIEL